MRERERDKKRKQRWDGRGWDGMGLGAKKTTERDEHTQKATKTDRQNEKY